MKKPLLTEVFVVSEATGASPLGQAYASLTKAIKDITALQGQIDASTAQMIDGQMKMLASVVQKSKQQSSKPQKAGIALSPEDDVASVSGPFKK